MGACQGAGGGDPRRVYAFEASQDDRSQDELGLLSLFTKIGRIGANLRDAVLKEMPQKDEGILWSPDDSSWDTSLMTADELSTQAYELVATYSELGFVDSGRIDYILDIKLIE